MTPFTLYPFQETGRDFLALRKNAILADDMGLGKTIQAIEALKKLDIKKALIVCPLSVRRTWYKTLRAHYPIAFLKEITSPKQIPDPNAINVVNYDIVWKEPFILRLREHSWQALVCDEAHFLKNITSKRTKTILGRKGVYGLCERRWMMTGTPILNRPVELYPMLRSLSPETLGPYRDYYRYAYRFCGAYQDTFGFNVSGATHLDELSRVLAPIMLRRLKADVLKDLPAVTYEKVYLDPTDKLMKATEEEKALSISKLGEISSVRRALGVIKIAPAITHLEELLETKDKVVVFTWHKDVAQGLKDHFKARAALYTGAESISQKDEAVNGFTKGKVQLFIGQLKAAGVGLDGLQEVCDVCVFVEMSYVPGEIFQAVDRLRRIGQSRPVLAQFLVAENSMDEELVDSLTAKAGNIKTILQEKGEVKFLKAKCPVCGCDTEIKELWRAAGLTVCKKCKKDMECIL